MSARSRTVLASRSAQCDTHLKGESPVLSALSCTCCLQYENIYCVLRGKKVFHLLPPTELYRMGLRRYPAARFEPQVRRVRLARCLYAQQHHTETWAAGCV